jgi:hypothetical protein
MLSAANPSFARPIAEKPVLFAHLKMVCHFRDTTASTKEGLSEEDKIVSNLDEQMSRWGI